MTSFLAIDILNVIILSSFVFNALPKCGAPNDPRYENGERHERHANGVDDVTLVHEFGVFVRNRLDDHVLVRVHLTGAKN